MAELTLSAGDIAAALKKNLEGFVPSLEARTVGRVTEIGDGIARVSGLPDCAVNELLEFESGVLGLALNLDEASIGAVVLGALADRIGLQASFAISAAFSLIVWVLVAMQWRSIAKALTLETRGPEHSKQLIEALEKHVIRLEIVH